MVVRDSADSMLELRLIGSLTWFPVIPMITINLDILNSVRICSKKDF
jgi:hypothetical protein